MPQQPEAREPDFSQRVITALTDLANLSLRTSTLRFSSPDTLEQLATFFLSRLVALCEARQGALFLAQHPSGHVDGNTQEPLVFQPTLSLLAHTQMSVEEAHAALEMYTSVADPLQWSVNLPPTLVWRRSLETPLVNNRHPDQAIPQPYALLLFAWPLAEGQIPENPFLAREEALKLLPFLVDAVDTILLQLLLASSEREPSETLLPAELLATVGHEFRGPLTTIQGYATTLLLHDQRLAAEERQDFLRAISEAGTHLGKLVDRFLELAQFETNASPFAPTPVDLVVLAQEAITAVKKTRPHPLILATPLPNPCSSGERAEKMTHRDELAVLGDRHWLRTMLDILLENAVAYSEQDALIEVSIEPSDSAHLRAVLSTPPGSDTHVALILPGAFQANEVPLELRVRDHGRGIGPVHLSRIFQRFYRVDTRLTRDVDGLGLGLALCKAIVAMHRGMLWVESRMGEGSTFHILLPRVAVTTREKI